MQDHRSRCNFLMRRTELRSMPLSCPKSRGAVLAKARSVCAQHIFHRVQVGRIGRDASTWSPWMGGDPLCDSFSVMNGSPILQQDHRTPQMPKQVTQEGSDIQPREITAAQPEIERHALARGRHSQALIAEIRSCLYRSRTIGVRPLGAQVRATLGMSRKPDSSRKTRWTPSSPTFFICGQRDRFHRAIAASFRCSARRSGF